MSIANGVMTILPAPKGYEVDFDHPQRHENVVATYWIVAVGNFLALLFMGQRLYTKTVLLREFRWEDACLLFAWITSIGMQAVLVYTFAAGVVGVHIWEMSADHYSLYHIMILVIPVIYAPCTGLAKMSMLLFYGQLSSQKWVGRFLMATIILVLGYILSFSFSLIFGCNPIAKSWDATITEGSCINRDVLYIVSAWFNIATNAVILALPIPLLVGVKLCNLQKVILCTVFALGGLTVATSVMRLAVLLPALRNPDQPWAIAVPFMWVCVEANLLIIYGALPTLRGFLTHVAPGWLGERYGDNVDDDDPDRLTTSSTGKSRTHRFNNYHNHNNDDGMDLALRPDRLLAVVARAGTNSRSSRMWDARPVKSDGDSERAIFQTRTMTITYETCDGIR